MRARLVTSFAVGTLALAFAAQALADAPAQDLPGPDAAFTAGDPITFTATAVNNPVPTRVDFYVSTEMGTGSDGVFTSLIDYIRGNPSGNPGQFVGSPGPYTNWPSKPGDYYWQAVEVNCPIAPCASGPRPLHITPLPASAVTSGAQIETYLDRHPKHRTHKRKVKFKFSSNVAGVRFRCLFASGWEKCKSPQVFRRLQPGRYKFKVRAVLNKDLRDKTPAKWVYRILRGGE
jgi:hypothetical protein